MANIKNLNPSDPNKGINMSLPTKGSTNWSEDFENLFAIAIRDHDHSGDGKGAIISAVELKVGTLRNVADQNQVLSGGIGGISFEPVDSSGDIFTLSNAGDSMVVEYVLKQTSGTASTGLGLGRSGQLFCHRYMKDNATYIELSDEYMGDDLDIVFNVNESTGKIEYTISSNNTYDFRFFIRKVVLG